MKKIFTFVLLVLVLASTFSSASFFRRNRKAGRNSMRYSDLRVTFVTTQGSATFYLYPEAAPETVASFLNLAKRGYYNNNSIHRAIENFVVQAGDPTGTGRGGPGYTIKDEIVTWLDFFQPGMLAMANAGPDTGGSQYFITVYPAEWLNGRHTVFGEYVNDADFEVVKRLEYGDVIREIRFQGDIDGFLSLHKAQIDEWNERLDEEYPTLRQYPIRAASPTAMTAYQAELNRIYSRNDRQKNDKQSFIPRTIRKVEEKLTREGSDSTTENPYDVELGTFQSDLDQLEAELNSIRSGD